MTLLERLLAQCLDDIEQGHSVEECLARYPERREELEPLLRVAQRVRSAADVVPSASFRQSARARLLTSIQGRAGVKAPDRAPQQEGMLDRLRLRLELPVLFRRLSMPALATIALIILLGMMSIGVAYASSESLPGDSLYPVKLAGERVRLALSSSETAEARLRLRLADERLQEGARLTEMGREDDVETLMIRYVTEVEAASQILQSQYAEGRDVTQLSNRLLEELVRQQAVLGRLQEKAPAGTQAAIARAMAASRTAEKQAQATMEREPATQPASTPTATVTATATPTPSETPWATRSQERKPTHTPTGTTRPVERLAPSDTPGPPGQTKTPQPPGQTRTPQPPGQTRTPQPPGQTRTPQPPGQTRTPQPPGQTKTPQPPGQTMTPGTSHSG